MNKIVKRLLIGIACVAVVLVGGFYAMFHNELATLQSMKKVDDYALYTMEYKGDYGFDDFLATGVSTDAELIQFVSTKLWQKF